MCCNCLEQRETYTVISFIKQLHPLLHWWVVWALSSLCITNARRNKCNHSQKNSWLLASLQQNITDAPWDITADKPICFQIHDTTYMQNSSLPCTGKSKPWSSRFQTPVQQLPGEWYSSLIFQVPTYQQQPQHSFPLPLLQLLMQALWTFSALSSGWPEDAAPQPVIVGSFTAAT